MRTLIALLLTASAAIAGQTDPEWNPPSRFDHAYSGTLHLTMLPQERVQAACRKLFLFYKLKDATSTTQHGCAKAFPDRCYVIIADHTYMGAKPVSVLRHELGHCNGWSGSHPD